MYITPKLFRKSWLITFFLYSDKFYYFEYSRLFLLYSELHIQYIWIFLIDDFYFIFYYFFYEQLKFDEHSVNVAHCNQLRIVTFISNRTIYLNTFHYKIYTDYLVAREWWVIRECRSMPDESWQCISVRSSSPKTF